MHHSYMHVSFFFFFFVDVVMNNTMPLLFRSTNKCMHVRIRVVLCCMLILHVATCDCISQKQMHATYQRAQSMLHLFPGPTLYRSCSKKLHVMLRPYKGRMHKQFLCNNRCNFLSLHALVSGVVRKMKH